MNIEEIMKPYFDKKDELENKNKINDISFEEEQYLEKEKEINDSYLRQIEILNLRLNNLRKNKSREIAEYLEQEYLNKTNFLGYEAVKKDLEQEYLKIEQNIENQIQGLQKEKENQIQKLQMDKEQTYLEKEREVQKQKDNLDKFYRVDIREMVEVKEEVRKNLISERKRLNNALEEMKLNLNSIMNKLSNFKYVYDENYVVQNGSEYKKLFDESHSLIDTKNNILKQLKQIEDYLVLTELTSKEIETLMRSMNPVERQEYDRRKSLINNVVEEYHEGPAVLNLESELENNLSIEIPEELEDYQGDYIIIDKESKIDLAKKEDNQEELSSKDILKQNVDKLLDEIYTDIVGYATKLRQMPIELSKEDKKLIQLPTGMYINESDLNNAVKKYYKKVKAKTYKIEGISKEFTITKDSIKVLKEALKNCSAVELVRAKKLGSYDLKRVFARERVENIENAAKEPVEIMADRKHYTGMPTGWYISGEEFIQKLPLLFEEKREKWLNKLIVKKEDKKLRKKLTALEKIINSKLNSNSAYAIHYEKLCNENPGLREVLEEYKQTGDLEQIKPLMETIPGLKDLLSEITGYSVLRNSLKKEKRNINYDYAFGTEEEFFEEDFYEPVKTR